VLPLPEDELICRVRNHYTPVVESGGSTTHDDQYLLNIASGGVFLIPKETTNSPSPDIGASSEQQNSEVCQMSLILKLLSIDSPSCIYKGTQSKPFAMPEDPNFSDTSLEWAYSTDSSKSMHTRSMDMSLTQQRSDHPKSQITVDYSRLPRKFTQKYNALLNGSSAAIAANYKDRHSRADDIPEGSFSNLPDRPDRPNLHNTSSTLPSIFWPNPQRPDTRDRMEEAFTENSESQAKERSYWTSYETQLGQKLVHKRIYKKGVCKTYAKRFQASPETAFGIVY
jgi:hypothetical protein